VTTNSANWKPSAPYVGDLLYGQELAMVEVLLYLIDTGVVDKGALEARLALKAIDAERDLNGLDRDGASTALPIRRLVALLRGSVLVDEEGDPIDDSSPEPQSQETSR